MDTKTDYYEQISEIRSIMVKSSRFLSLSGLSGIIIGIYAITGAITAASIIYLPNGNFRKFYVNDILPPLFIIGMSVLILSIVTGLILNHREAKKKNTSIFSPASLKMMANIFFPLAIGGIFSLIMIYRGYWGIIAPNMLIFYGLALINGGRYTLSEIRKLGYIDVFLGLICAILPGYGLIFWTIGFGVLHIIYGSIMYNKYQRKN
jgi:hypothetical protein